MSATILSFMSSEIQVPNGYITLKNLSSHSPIYLCRERATNRLTVIKLFTKKSELSFLRESKAMARLAGCPWVASLYFAIQTESVTPGEERFVLGTQYRSGQDLVILREKLPAPKVRDLRRAIRLAVGELHEKWGIAHGDLSPKNILACETSDVSQPWQITFVDWEFSTIINEDVLSNYSHYRGTLGFNQISSGIDPLTQDLNAIEACFNFLDKTEEPTDKKTRSWLSWI